MMFRTPHQHLALVLVAVVLNAYCASLTNAQVLINETQLLHEITQDFKLLPHDGEAYEQFGNAVAICGDTIIVGSFFDSVFGYNSGSAYLFDSTTGLQISKLLPNDGAAYDLFGVSVAINGSTVLVGAWEDDDNGLESGSAYLFDSTNGQQIAKLLPHDGEASDFFGSGVAISGTTALVGAYNDNDNGIRSGSAYLFDTTTGEQIAKLLPNDGAAEDEFGEILAMSGNTAIVGVPLDDDNGDRSGSAYLFDTSTGQQIAKLLPSDGQALDFFGRSVAINGNIAVVGAVGDDNNGSNSGSAYLFDISSGQQIAKLLPFDGANGDRFGVSAAISGNTVVIGAAWDQDNGIWSGSAYLFDAATGILIAKLLPRDGASQDFFGYSVAISGTKVVAGAASDDDLGEFTGSAYVFSVPSCSPDLTNDGSLDFFDVSAFLTAYAANDPVADFNADGSFNFFDVSAFLVAYLDGCP